MRRHRQYEQAVGWKTARQNYLTADEARRLLSGEHPLRVWREKRGLTQRALAEAAGIAASYLAEMEAEKKPGSVLALRKLAAVLAVPMDDLAVSPPQHRRSAATRGRHALGPG